nr:S8 family serine peptidase [Bacteroidota bacterium]
MVTSAQVAPDKYWVRFTDKNNSPFSVDNPGEFLTQQAINRRTAQGISVVENDLPVNAPYIAAVVNTGATLLNVSKWFNSVTVFTDSPDVIVAINALPFVSSVDQICHKPVPWKKTKKSFFDNESESEIPNEKLLRGNTAGQSYDYGQAWNQINMLNGIALHDLGFDGLGMTIAVLDAGFKNANVLSAFDSLWMNNRILGWKDFADPLNPDIFNSHTHGTSVLSTMGANLPGQMVGTAPRANYWLLRSEYGPSEYLVEEMNWISAAEFADSVGADIINSSLGYTTFDDPSQNHTYQDMNGKTTPVTIGADLAASKGILVVNSAGNSGNSSWLYIGAPADGDSVFTIGAVNSSGIYASFSSIGPTYDGRTKPDVVAQGQGSTIISANSGNVVSGNGTSFSSPITAGMVACLWQAHPDSRNTEIMEAIRQSGSLANSPTMFLGWGIPDYLSAHTLLSEPVIHDIELNVKLFLEGPYNGTAMDTELNAILPLTQPYNDSPFNYPGEEQVTEIPAPDIVDWILVELRDAPSASQAFESTTISRKAAFLKQDGSVVDTGGTNPLTFTVPVSDSIFLVIRHRNHLGVMTSIALKNNGGNVYTYDFTTGTTKAYGGIAGYKEIGDGIYGLVSGDGNADGFINLNDKLLNWNPKAGDMEYHPGDYNCDTQIDNVDKDEYWLPNRGFEGQVPE